MPFRAVIVSPVYLHFVRSFYVRRNSSSKCVSTCDNALPGIDCF
jgi:hypothetical protein